MNRADLYHFPPPDPPKKCATEGCRNEASAFVKSCPRCHEELAAREAARLRAELAPRVQKFRARSDRGTWVLVVLALMALLVVLFGGGR